VAVWIGVHLRGEKVPDLLQKTRIVFLKRWKSSLVQTPHALSLHNVGIANPSLILILRWPI
ncbi:MAG: hypothetical protein NW208_05350, partial [Bryobacter sp.]|nr:hypothetical protein [Bryobacter sp.]